MYEFDGAVVIEIPLGRMGSDAALGEVAHDLAEDLVVFGKLEIGHWGESSSWVMG